MQSRYPWLRENALIQRFVVAILLLGVIMLTLQFAGVSEVREARVVNRKAGR